MTAIRRNIITGDRVIFAPERAERPNAFGIADLRGECPFCPGNEAQTPPEVLRVEDGKGWRVRVFPNKYPVTINHEVIVESRDHEATFDQIADPAGVVDVYIDRYTTLMRREEVAYVALFKNHGPGGGASIPHIHSQIMAMSFAPARIERESWSFANAAQCPLCAAITMHRRENLVIRETDTFVWFAPIASAMPYQQWIAPRRHQPEIATLSVDEKRDLAAFLQASAAAMQRRSDSYNWLLLNFPREPAAHFYVDLFPRVVTIAGFELETGSFIEIIDPAETARVMKE